MFRTVTVRARHPDESIDQFACRAETFGLDSRQPTSVRLWIQDRREEQVCEVAIITNFAF